MPTFTAAQLAEKLDAELIGDGLLQISGFAPADRAQVGILPLPRPKSIGQAERGWASAILVGGNATSSRKDAAAREKIRAWPYARALPLFFPEPQYAPGIIQAPSWPKRTG
jgi:UDP-3-O-[3-hydroxymyristoyl] glucosamine N-acyltransferase